MSYLLSAFTLIVQVVFGAIATLFLVRLLAEASRAEFHNPLSQFVYRYTNPVLVPLRRVLPNWRRINIAALLILLLTFVLERLLLFVLAGFMPAWLGLLVLSLADLLDFVLLFYIVVIFGWSLLTMFSPDPYNPLIRLAGALVEPVLRPLRGRLVIGSIDFSPTVVVIALLLAQRLIAAPLFDFGASLTRLG
jgi:YggT family protein